MDFITDLLTLDVVTVTGSIVIKAKDTDNNAESAGSPIIDFDKMFTEIKKVNTNSTIRVLAATRVQIDRDTTNFVASDLSEQEVPLVQMHFSAVSSAMESRSAVIARFRSKIAKK